MKRMPMEQISWGEGFQAMEDEQMRDKAGRLYNIRYSDKNLSGDYNLILALSISVKLSVDRPASEFSFYIEKFYCLTSLEKL